MNEKKKPLRYFFYNGDLHKKLHIHRGNDVIIAWNYPKGSTCRHSYRDVKRNGEKAFSTTQVAKMMNRATKAVYKAITSGSIERPQITYGIDEDRKQHAYYWNEANIMELHEYLLNVHIGRPRKDGLITASGIPTASELRAMIRHGTVFYVKDIDGNFVPTWDAERF